MISRVTHGSYILNHGMCSTTGSSQSMRPWSTSSAKAATVTALPVEPVGKIVSASTFSSSPSLRTPKPRLNVISPFSTIEIAIPGTPTASRTASARASKSCGGAATTGNATASQIAASPARSAGSMVMFTSSCSVARSAACSSGQAFVHQPFDGGAAALIDNLELASVKFLNSVTERSSIPQPQE